jgi:two-component system LytT family response regulator/two-component system response regulator AlgR
MPLRIALADDEPVARGRLARLLRDAGCEVAAEVEDGRALLAWMAGGPPLDALFLDVRMPGASGLEILAELESPPPVVFVTSSADHAVAAFDQSAVDYLLKPVTAERLARALERIEVRLATRQKGAEARPQGGTQPHRFPVKAGDGKLLLDLKRCSHFEVEDQVVFAWAGGKRFRTAWTALSEVETAFPEVAFLRIQRHLLLRSEAVLGLRTLATGRKAVMVGEGLELEVSRTAVHHLKERLGL